MYIGLHVKYPLSLSEFNASSILSTDFQKIHEYQISRKSAQWEPSCSMRADDRTDGQADMTKLIVAFRNFVNRPKNLCYCRLWRIKLIWFLFKDLAPTSTETYLLILLRPEIAANCEKYAKLINLLLGGGGIMQNLSSLNFLVHIFTTEFRRVNEYFL